MTSLKYQIISSHIKARKKIKQLERFKDLPREMVVHHINRDPFNNDLSNLVVMNDGEHVSLHAELLRREESRPIEEILKELNRELVLYNFNFASQ